MEIDPVCGMEVDLGEGAGQSEIGNRTFYFCSPDCKEAFDENPSEYVE